MKELQNETLKEFLQRHFTTILSFVMLLLATYITYRLAPIAQDIALLNIRVNAVEQKETDGVTREQFQQANIDTTHRLDIISSRLDTLISKLLH